MTDTPDTPQAEQPVSNPPAEAQTTEHMIPKSRFDEVNEKYKQLATELEQFRQQQAQAKQQELAEQERWKELYEQSQQKLGEFENVQQQAQSYRAQIEAYNQADIERIPEDKRYLVPTDFIDDPIKLREYLNGALPGLLETPKPKAPSLDGGSGVSDSSTTRDAVGAGVATAMDIARMHGFQVNQDRVANFARNPQKPTNLEDKE